MNFKRFDLGGISINNKLYALGGNSSNLYEPDYLQDIEMYDPVQNKWEVIDSLLNKSRQGLRIAKVDNYIFAIGGYNGTSLDLNESFNASGSATVYNPIFISSISVNPMAGVVPFDVIFNITISGGSGSYKYLWDFGDGSFVSTIENPTHKYNTKGTYAVKVTITDAFDSNNTAIGTLNIIAIENSAPYSSILIDSFRANPMSGIAPLDVTFNIAISGGSGSYKYLWDFGDGKSSSSANITHRYDTSGTYTASIIVKDVSDTTNIMNGTLSIKVIDNPDPYSPVLINDISADPITGPAPQDVSFSVKASGGSGIYLYLWDYGDGIYDTTSANPKHRYETTGVYSAKVIVTDTGNSTNSAEGTLNINITPAFTPVKIDEFSANPIKGAAPLDVAFLVKASGGSGNYLYVWKFDDGTTEISSANPTHRYSFKGIYSPRVTVTDAGNQNNTDVKSINIEVDDASTSNNGQVSTSDNKKKKKGICFISDVIKNNNIIKLIYRYRDNYLMESKSGKFIVNFYYEIFPF